MKRWGMMILVLGLAVMAWGKEKASQPPSWERPRSAKDFSAEMASSQAFSETRQIRQPLGSYGVTKDPYVGWVSTYPSYYSTSLGPGGTQGNFAASDTPDTAHWFRYWLGPYERIDWHINSSNPGYTKYNAYLYQSVDGQPGALLTEAAGADNPDSIVFQNSSAGTYVFLRFTLLRGNAYDDYTLWGIGAGTQTSPVYLSSFSLNGALQDRDEIMDGVAARMIPGRYDDWYYWYWPDTIAGQPVEAIKLDLAFDSTRINLDLYAVSPNLDTLLAGTNGPHYSAGTGWVTKETGWIYRSHGDTTGVRLNVHTTNDYGFSQVYRISNATAMTASGVEVAYPAMGEYYSDAYPGATFINFGMEVNYNSGMEGNSIYYNPGRHQAPPPPISKKPVPPPFRVVGSSPPGIKPPPVPRPAPIPPVRTPVIQNPQRIEAPVQRIQAPVQIQQPVRPQQPVIISAPPSPQPPPPRVAPSETPGVSAGGGKSS